MMAELNFTKMQGAGNDFIVIDNRRHTLSKEKIISLAPGLCHRRFGIGADGVLALLPPGQSLSDYTMFYRNADGSDAGMCGNGARCLALYADRIGLGSELKFNVHDAAYKASVDAGKGNVTISFPMQLSINEVILDNELELYQVHAGTEHIVKEISAEDFEKDEMLEKYGERLRYHNQFNPPGTNVNFICGSKPDAFRIKTYERGVEGVTLACGTGAIAAAVAWHHFHDRGSPAGKIKAQAEGGTLSVDYRCNSKDNSYSSIKLTGEAAFVFQGSFKY